MLYCKDCRLLNEAAECGCCGRKRLKPPKNNDVVYLTTLENIWAGALAEILKNNGILFLKEGFRRGTGIVRIMSPDHFPEYQFFIHFGDLEQARDLLAIMNNNITPGTQA